MIILHGQVLMLKKIEPQILALSTVTRSMRPEVTSEEVLAHLSEKGNHRSSIRPQIVQLWNRMFWEESLSIETVLDK